MNTVVQPVAAADSVADFVSRWKGNTGSERANFQSFVRELCSLLDLPLPDPGEAKNEHNAYVFERFIAPQRADATIEKRFIDLYRRNSFVLEGKQTGKALASRSHQNAIGAALSQAERYVRGLPLEEVEQGRPPFIVVVDVGNAIYLFSEFSRTGGNYVAFPDPRRYEIRLDDLHDPEVQDRLRRLWLEPDSLDPSKYAAQVTKEVSVTLAELAKSLEHSGFEVERVANFLKRCLFTMFAEDVELLPRRSFHDLLVNIKERNPEAFPDAVRSLWEAMGTGGYENHLMQRVRHFNGGLFKDIDPIPLTSDQIQLLINASKVDWRYVEPAIFGTLLERALEPRERHKLGAHYTPREYVERLVMPTLIEPLREQWGDVRAAAETLLRQDKPAKAVQEAQAFHYQLCQIRVLDPACGSANFLYVALEHMKRLEGEVLAFIAEFSEGQTVLETEGLTVDPHQFLGLEINPRAAAIAELVLWIGYLQWHHRLSDRLDLPEPILRDFKNIECRDALIEYDNREPQLDDSGKPVTIWDGVSMKVSPATGALVPDETGRTTVYHYQNPRRAEWPEADYIVGNPPFIGNKRMREALGDGYVDAVRNAYKGAVPDSADFVMYWWHIAAEKVRHNRAQRFGFITTNSLRQTFNRRVLEPHLKDTKKPLSLIFAVPDHPWVDGNDGAAVRISMTVGAQGDVFGHLRQVVSELVEDDGSRSVVLSSQNGKLFANLGIGADITSAKPLQSNDLISNRGMIPHGESFLVSPEQGKALDGGALIRPYRNGRDLTSKSRGFYVLDTFDLEEDELRDSYPETWQWLFDRVKPSRDENKRKSVREKWWRFAEPRKVLRAAHQDLDRYVATVQTSKHKFFTFLSTEIVPDDKLIAIALDGAQWMGLLSSRVHVSWALAAGGALGVGNDPVYNKTRSFDAFPFPNLNDEQCSHIGNLAEQIDAHRKRQQMAHTKLTITEMYNVMEKLRADETFTAKDKVIHQQGLVSLLSELHDKLDRAVFEAYGWDDLADKLVGCPGVTTPLPDKPADQAEAEEELLMRLVALNKERAAEEARGIVRWLRPEYQAPDAVQAEVDLDLDQIIAPKAAAAPAKRKASFPKSVPEQLKILRKALSEHPHTTESLAELFKYKPKKPVEDGLLSLVAVGRAEYEEATGTWYGVG